jgi:dihydropteroate synthase
MPDVPVSVDTCHARTAAHALDAGAVVVNDVSACRHDPELLDVLVQYRPGYVLMHAKGAPRDMQDDPRYGDVRSEVAGFLAKEMDRLIGAGLPEDRIVLDPGIGFGKTAAHGIALLAHPEDLLGLGRPLLVGISMKSLFGALLGLPPESRGAVTQTASALLWERGVFWHRVHDVEAVRQGLALARILRDGDGLARV